MATYLSQEQFQEFEVVGHNKTSRLIGSGPSDRPSSSVRTRKEFCRSRDHFRYLVNDCWTTKITSSRITSPHPGLTGGVIGLGSYPSVEVQLTSFSLPDDRVGFKELAAFLKYWFFKISIFLIDFEQEKSFFHLIIYLYFIKKIFFKFFTKNLPYVNCNKILFVLFSNFLLPKIESLEVNVLFVQILITGSVYSNYLTR